MGKGFIMRLFLGYLAASITSALIALLAVNVFASTSGSTCGAIFTQNFDSVTPPALPAGWVASQGVNVTGAPLWVTSNITPHTSPNDAFSIAPGYVLDNRLDTPAFTAGMFDHTVLFRSNYNLESG